eukprot:CAMPEP_0206154310 /NCGR_PEP_ID=MMETSP1474-20131121/1289_1 /ASSEMBLY_ACC=CAM_ASM_001110 /TAXON_ID=97495 /ORGANISM="Imantonia sp., Strain RCC918" /LENGTH=76 /DNA_ID=CAMNT_0053552473 /DNA_START=20 /DNA_END=247 /DNA_ORIENTATION=+
MMRLGDASPGGPSGRPRGKGRGRAPMQNRPDAARRRHPAPPSRRAAAFAASDAQHPPPLLCAQLPSLPSSPAPTPS